MNSNGGCPGNADGDNSSATCTLEELNVLSDVVDAVGNNASISVEYR